MRQHINRNFSAATKEDLEFGRIAKKFIEVQKGRGNSSSTVNHYERTIKKLAKFLCWFSRSEEVYFDLDDEERVAEGLKQKISVFENITVESSFREFLKEIESVNEVTVNTYFRDYRAIAYWMMDIGYIDNHEIIIKKVETDIKEVYTAEEISRLLKKPKADCSFVEYRNWVVIHHLLATGNRVSTICSIKIKDVDWGEGMLSIQVQKNKHKTRIPLEETYLKVLQEYVDTWLVDADGKYITEYLFPSAYADSKDPLDRTTLGKSIAEYNKSRKVKKTSTHLFRHTFAKYWIMAGKDLHSLQKMLGHSTLDMVTHYANLYDVDLKSKVEEKSILKEQKSKVRNSGRMISRQKSF